MKELLKKKRLEMKNPGIFASGDAVKEETDQESVKDEDLERKKAKEDTANKKSDLAPETEESEKMEGLLDDESYEENDEMDEAPPVKELSEEEMLAKLFNPSDEGKPGIAGKVAALMKEKMSKLKGK